MRRPNVPSLVLVGPTGAMPAPGPRLAARSTAPSLAGAGASLSSGSCLPRRLPPPAPLPTLDPACARGMAPHGVVDHAWQRLRRWLVGF
ncbi:hypothetical protein [Piscinibacter sakaiensis]|uniref:hypothetical protein n=1 Tax=Piscinibacter sakaiensis TaxID=1547922 RepID=UPI0006B64115|nr:hypothetical protein [Piscinibacter sakaiensis]